MGSIDQYWEKPVRVPDLFDHQVIVWRFNPKALSTFVDQFELLLSREEHARLNRFVDEEASRNFVICRGVLRFILSHMLNKSNQPLRIQNNPQGKPQLDLHGTTSDLHFNISHTKDLCVIVMGNNLEVGVDVESIHEMKNFAQMAHSYLTPEEYALWDGEELSGKLAKFYDFWCAKEAIMKASGYGLSIQPNQINTLDVLAGQGIKGRQADGCLFEIAECQLIELPLEKDFKGWLAVLGKPDMVLMNEFTNAIVCSFEREYE